MNDRFSYGLIDSEHPGLNIRLGFAECCEQYMSCRFRILKRIVMFELVPYPAANI